MATILRPYQEEAISKLRDKIKSGLKRVVLVSPTGSGKGAIAAEIVRSAAAKGHRVAYIVNRLELVKQASAIFEREGIPHGVLQGQNTWQAGRQVVICSIQTMARRRYEMFDVAVLDEVHGTPASQAYKTFFESHSNIVCIGLTATPWSKGMAKKHKWLNGEALWQDMVVGATIPDLIKQRFLTDVLIYSTAEEPDLSKVRKVSGDYDKAQLGSALNKAKLIGNLVQHYIKYGEGKQAVCFCVNTSHSRAVAQQFNDIGIPAVHVDGYMTSEERDPLMAAFRDRQEYRILCNCSLVSEGVDIPSVGCIILARSTVSLNRYLQMIGRGLRPYEGKDVCIILDHSGTVRRLGWPTEEMEYSLCDGSPKSKPENPPEKLPKVCPSCYAIYPRSQKVCPVCQFEPKSLPKEQDTEAGELVQMTKKGAKKYSMEKKQEIYSALLGHAKLKGFKPGWAYHQFHECVGVFPAGTLDKKEGPMCVEVEGWLKHKAIKWAKSQEKNFMRRAA